MPAIACSAPSRMIRWLTCFALMSFCLAIGPEARATPPSPDMPWTKREYLDFYFLYYKGTRPLPHLRSPEEKAYFDRMIDVENVSQIASGDLPAKEKRVQIAVILAIAGEFRAAYEYAVLVGEPLQEELTRVQAFTLDVLDAAVRIDSHPDDARRTTFFGVVDSLADRSRYSDSQIAMLASALALHYPAISRVLAETDRRSIRNRIAKLEAAEADPAVRAAYARLLKVAEEIESK